MTTRGRASDAAALRAEFDAAFAAPHPVSPDEAPLLVVRVGGERVAVPLTQVSFVVASGAVVPLPDAAPALLGLATVRGELVSVHSLAVLLGRTDVAGGARPLLVVDRSAAVALAVDAIERQIRLPRAALADGARRAPGASNLLSVASSGDETWTIVDVPAVLDGLRSRAPVHTQETSVR